MYEAVLDVYMLPVYQYMLDVFIAITCHIHAKAMYSSLLGCFAVFEKRGEQYGCILDVFACILHVLAV